MHTCCMEVKDSMYIASKHQLLIKEQQCRSFREFFFVPEWRCVIDDYNSLHSCIFIFFWKMSKCVEERAKRMFEGGWGNGSWWPVRPICLWLREFLGQSLLSCWLDVRSASEIPSFNLLLMICGVTAVHSFHCWDITWDINAHTQSDTHT